jgi:hypothetical protein
VGGVHRRPLFAKPLTGVNTVDCWTSRFSLWAAKSLAPSLGASGFGLEGQDFELMGDFDSVSAPGVAVLGIDIAGGLQGLRTAAIDPQKFSYNPCQHAGMRSNQT